MIQDHVLQELCVERAQLLRELAHVISRVGASHPQRAKVNAKRSVKRKALRRALRTNEKALAGRCMQLMELVRPNS
jgi:uncharacterized protein involved in exopolysaccharide biosynthesis